MADPKLLTPWICETDAGELEVGFLLDRFPVRLLNTLAKPLEDFGSGVCATSPAAGDIETRGGCSERGEVLFGGQ